MLQYFPVEVEQEPLVQAALMLRENRTGYVRVLLGGRNFHEVKFNRAIQSRRRPGASFQPVIYAAALEKGFTRDDKIMDSPMKFVAGVGKEWSPKNDDGKYKGNVSLADAIIESRNIPAIRVLNHVGIYEAVAYAGRLGYTSRLPQGLTMALGSGSVSVEEQVRAYSVFPNRGRLVPNIYITKIVDRHGKVLEENQPPVLSDKSASPGKPASNSEAPSPTADAKSAKLDQRREDPPRRPVGIKETTARTMASLLQEVVQRGTATVLKEIVGRKDIAGKTGTTKNNVDAWFMGFSPDYTCGVWVGFDDESSLGPGESGAQAAAPIWGYFMKEVLKDTPEKEFH
ncbi:penicillin-binding transpeptidase domain-containing protein [Thermodesulfobacteriota bacterium]